MREGIRFSQSPGLELSRRIVGASQAAHAHSTPIPFAIVPYTSLSISNPNPQSGCDDRDNNTNEPSTRVAGSRLRVVNDWLGHGLRLSTKPFVDHRSGDESVARSFKNS